MCSSDLLSSNRSQYKSGVSQNFCSIEKFSISKVSYNQNHMINLTNHKGCRQFIEPIKTQKQLRVADAKRGKMCASSACVTCIYVVQSLNSPFSPPHIGAEPEQAKRESRITCMRMFRTPPFFPPNRGKTLLGSTFKTRLVARFSE